MLRYKTAYNFCTKKPSPEFLKNLLALIKKNPNITLSSEKLDELLPEIEYDNKQKSLPYLKSLFYERKSAMDIDYKEMAKNNINTFTEEIFKPDELLKNLSDDEKNRIHLLADIKLEEIQDSGLSRSELAGFESKLKLFEKNLNQSQKRNPSSSGCLLPIHQNQSSSKRNSDWKRQRVHSLQNCGTGLTSGFGLRHSNVRTKQKSHHQNHPRFE